MNARKRALTVAVWLVSLFAAAIWGRAQTQVPPREPRLPPAVLPAPKAPTVFSGADVGFRVESWQGNTPVGALVVRVDGQWVEVQRSLGVKKLTTR